MSMPACATWRCHVATENNDNNNNNNNNNSNNDRNNKNKNTDDDSNNNDDINDNNKDKDNKNNKRTLIIMTKMIMIKTIHQLPVKHVRNISMRLLMREEKTYDILIMIKNVQG